jgi:hypothetical protein
MNSCPIPRRKNYLHRRRRVICAVIPTNEEKMIALDAIRLGKLTHKWNLHNLFFSVERLFFMKVDIDTSDMLYAEAWQGFKGTDWQAEINVRDFIQHNYTPYEGDESFRRGDAGNHRTVAKSDGGNTY